MDSAVHRGAGSRGRGERAKLRDCGKSFVPKYGSQRYCSHGCGVHSKGSRQPQPDRRTVPRPPYEQLMADVRSTSFVAAGRKYGVSDNAVRKWIRWYEYQREMEARRAPQDRAA